MGIIMYAEIRMSKMELYRVTVVEKLISGEYTTGRAAKLLGITPRQIKRLKKKYRENGPEGLIHGNRNRSSNRKIAPGITEKIEELYREKYHDFGPTLASEKLRELHGIDISRETLRRILISKGLHTARRRRNSYKQRRPRKEHFGELVQIDGSKHDWFEGRRPPCMLMNMVDDATGTTFSMFFEEETSRAVMTVVWGWIRKYGIMEALYSDHKNTYVNDTEPTIEQQLSGTLPTNDFREACKELGIEIITANTPQAKGRVERNHAVYQDRLVKELRLRGISTIEEANRFLRERFIADLNRRFSIPPKSVDDRHIGLLGRDLRPVFCFRRERTVANDFVIRYKNRFFQIAKDSEVRPLPGKRVLLKEWLDGSIHVETFEGQYVKIKEITEDLKGGSVAYPQIPREGDISTLLSRVTF